MANLLLWLGRIVLASLFILGGIDKILDPARSIASMEDVGLPMSGLLIWVVIAVELGGGLLVAFTPLSRVPFARLAAFAALGLAAHTALVNMIFHPFWTFEEAQARAELSFFFKNVAIIGGLIFFAGCALKNGKPGGR